MRDPERDIVEVEPVAQRRVRAEALEPRFLLMVPVFSRLLAGRPLRFLLRLMASEVRGVQARVQGCQGNDRDRQGAHQADCDRIDPL